MKQITAILYLAVLTAMVSACSEDELADNTQPSGKVPMEFYANTDVSTRTELTTDNAVHWEANDAISLFDPTGTNNQFSTTQSGPSVTFTGKATPAKGTYYALYPYDVNAQIEGTTITTTLPAEQMAREGSFAQGLNPSVATADATNNLYFKNVCALVKFTLDGSITTTITKATLCGNNGEALAGTVTIDASQKNPITNVDPEWAGIEIALKGNLIAGKTYYFVTAPATLSNGLTLTLYNSDGHIWKKEGTQSATLTASRILNLGTVKPDNFIPAKGYEEINGIYHIYNADGLKAWASVLNKDVILEKDIDLTGVEWTPVGSDMNTGYAGEFNGNGKFIYNLTINSTESNVGFFGGLAAGGTVHDVKFANAQVTATSGGAHAGVIAGASMGKIESCNVRSSTVSGIYAGAIVGNNSVQVNGCNALDVTIHADKQGGQAGGIAGVNYGKIEYCTVSGKSFITANASNSRAGGIAGYTSEESGVSTSGRLLKCAVDGATISGTMAGGIAGENNFGIVAQCIANKVIVTHSSDEASTRLGGVVGYNTRGNVVASYAAYSTVGGQGLTSESMGGIVGYNNTQNAFIYGCYSTHVSILGSVNGDEAGIGSIAGYTSGHVTSCYAILPDEVTGISLVGKGTNNIDHCVEAGQSNYGTLIEATDLKDDDGSVWKAAKIWQFNAGETAPAINAEYIGENTAN